VVLLGDDRRHRLTLAVLRQATPPIGFWVFDFKKELAEWWRERQREVAAEVGGYYD